MPGLCTKDVTYGVAICSTLGAATAGTLGPTRHATLGATLGMPLLELLYVWRSLRLPTACDSPVGLGFCATESIHFSGFDLVTS